MIRTPLTALAVIGTLTFLVLSTDAITSLPSHEGTRRMVQRLERIAKDTVPPNPPMTEARIRSLRAQVVLTEQAVASLELQMELGYELLLDGKSEEALEVLSRAEQFAKAKGIEEQKLSRLLGDLLAISYIRLGEQQNCIAHHNPYSCYLPLPKSGVHRIRRGSEGAINVLKRILQQNPSDLGSRWLLNLAFMTLGQYPEKVPSNWLIPLKAFDSEYDIKPFREIAPELGLDTIGLAGGSIMEDFSGDGNLDIMASSCGLRDQLRYFQNSDDGTFVDRTTAAGLSGIAGGLNLVHADYNNDGHPDVLVLRGAWLREQGHHPNSLLRNNGDGTFSDVTEEAGLLSFHPTQTAAWGDFDNDGWLDVFIGNESEGKDKNPCELFRNNRNGTFTECAGPSGVATTGFVKGVAWGDYDNDGWLDLYVSRWGGNNALYRNEGSALTDAADRGQSPTKVNVREWKFRDVSMQAGVSRPGDNFATWFWDYDNDGWLDIFVAGYSLSNPRPLEDAVSAYLGLPSTAQRPCLFRNNRNGTFADVTRDAKLDRPVLVMGANFGDIDNDGFLDCYLGTGAPDLRTLIPNRMFRNFRGKYFQDVTSAAGVGHLQKGHGVSFGDIDNDGDQDLYAVIGGWYSGDVYQNVLYENPGHGNHWITLRLEGVNSNRSAIGSRIQVTVANGDQIRQIHSIVSTGGSFGASSLQQEIGLGQATAIRSIEVTWSATRTKQLVLNPPMDKIVKIREGHSELIVLDAKPITLGTTSNSFRARESLD